MTAVRQLFAYRLKGGDANFKKMPELFEKTVDIANKIM